MAKMFISYSHHDEESRSLLETHLAALKREGTIEPWHDRRILAGGDWAGQINESLEDSDIILLLISPYFIESDYCHDIEMARALERHNEGTAIVIPVILEHCDWTHLTFGKLRAIPIDGKPISKFPNVHEAFSEVAQEIRRVAEKINLEQQNDRFTENVKQNPITTMREIRSSNLRATRRFTDHEKDQFLLTAFEYMARFFENSIEELQKRNPQVQGKFRTVDANRFTANVYQNGRMVNECCIRLEGRGQTGFGIVYGPEAYQNTMNASLGVIDDGYSLYLKPQFEFGLLSSNEKQHLNFEGAAEYFWSHFIECLQR